jgi:tetratricopeptide (TPR) repeat protein
MVSTRAFKWHKTIRPRVLSGLCLCVLLNTAAASPETVQTLRYGTTLYQFFQQDYYSAITELMVARELQQLGSHEQRAELLRGGMSLSYGMDGEARGIFETLLSDPGELSSLEDRNRAWFYLAKMSWRRGDSLNTLSGLEKMSSDSEGQFSDQAYYLRSSIALNDGDEKAALAYADKLTVDSPWRYYLYYNLGGNQAAQGNFDAANKYYTRFDQMSFSTEESKEVRDKAFTAHGFSLMASNHFEEAMHQFTRVRLDSPMADRALLGYGWAASEMGDFALALSSWQTLTARDLGSPSAREGLLAIPYAYEQVGNSSVALQQYHNAANAYLQQLSSVKTAIAAFRDGNLVQTLDLSVGKPRAGVDAHGWVFGDDILPTGSHGSILTELLTRQGFQLALRELQDLYRIAWHLEDANKRLQNLAQVDADQQASWASVTDGGRRKASPHSKRKYDRHNPVPMVSACWLILHKPICGKSSTALRRSLHYFQLGVPRQRKRSVCH